jgi:hypothetical protein
MSSLPRQAALILSMHRSGTSALAGALVRLGFQAPKRGVDASADNPQGFYEPAALVAVNYCILAKAGFHWNTCYRYEPRALPAPTALFTAEAARLLSGEFSEPTSFVIKDPRLCMTLPFWLPALHATGADLRVVLMLRHPAEVTRSLEQRNQISDTEAAALWLHHTLEAEALTRHLPRGFVTYEGLLDDWRRSLNRAAGQAGLRWPRPFQQGAAAVDAFLSPQERHHRAAPSEARLGEPPVDELVAEAWQTLNALALAPADPRLQTALDKISARFAAWRQQMFPYPVPEELRPQLNPAADAAMESLLA